MKAAAKYYRHDHEKLDELRRRRKVYQKRKRELEAFLKQFEPSEAQRAADARAEQQRLHEHMEFVRQLDELEI